MDDSALVNVINAFAAFLTPEQAKTVMAWLYVASIVLAGLRWFLAWAAPRFSNHPVVVAIDRLLNKLVANSKPLELRKNVVKERLSSPPPPPKRKSTPPGPPYGFCLALALGVLLAGCAHASTEDAFRAGLSTFAAVADPAYELAMNACTTAEQAIVDRVKAQGYKPAYTEDFEAISTRCHEAREVFDAMREAHDRAATFVESGKLAKLLGGAP